jgi:serine/threonine protein kinase
MIDDEETKLNVGVAGGGNTQLPVGTTLQSGKYRIEKVLGQGGFGITYLAEHTVLDRKVAIKEFFFKEYCDRQRGTSGVVFGTTGTNSELVERFKQKFLKEAKTIARLNHPNIVSILDIFTENGTAYYVMEYISGKSLDDVVKEEGAVTEGRAVNYIRQVGDALNYMHKRKLCHLDVKPANIMVDMNGHVTLIDFGLSKQYDVQGGQTSTTPVGISHGYAPLEQYNAGGVSEFSPQTDVYSLGATLYKLVTSKTPPQASDILNFGLPTLPSNLSDQTKDAITHSINTRKMDRPASIEAFLDLLPNYSGKRESEDMNQVSGNGNSGDAIAVNLEDNKELGSFSKKHVLWLSLAFIVYAIIFYIINVLHRPILDFHPLELCAVVSVIFTLGVIGYLKCCKIVKWPQLIQIVFLLIGLGLEIGWYFAFYEMPMLLFLITHYLVINKCKLSFRLALGVLFVDFLIMYISVVRWLY